MSSDLMNAIMDVSRETVRAEAAIMHRATFLRMETDVAIVMLNGAEVQVPIRLGGFIPEPNQSVTVLKQGYVLFLLGPADNSEMFGSEADNEVIIQDAEPLTGFELWVDPNATAPVPTMSHTDLTDLDADDHPQYLTEARADALYLTPDAASAQFDPQFVDVAGDTMTGDLAVVKTAPEIAVRSTAVGSVPTVALDAPAGTNRRLTVESNGVLRWAIVGSDGAETGSNAGTSFGIYRYDDAGTYIDAPISVNRQTGLVTTSAMIVSTATPSGTKPAGVVWVQY